MSATHNKVACRLSGCHKALQVMRDAGEMEANDRLFDFVSKSCFLFKFDANQYIQGWSQRLPPPSSSICITGPKSPQPQSQQNSWQNPVFEAKNKPGWIAFDNRKCRHELFSISCLAVARLTSVRILSKKPIDPSSESTDVRYHASQGLSFQVAGSNLNRQCLFATTDHRDCAFPIFRSHSS
jgi:hypothetical protein